MQMRHDALIVGAGIAGLRAAVELAGKVDTAVVSKVFPTRSHSGAAQGGIGAALGNEEEDSWEWHMFDTVKGSDFLGDQDAIEILARDAPRAIVELEHMGVPFSRTADGKIAQRAFGGHTRDFGKAPVKRACYASDRTGRVIMDTLYEQCLKAGVRFYSEFVLLDLLTGADGCCGVVLLNLADGSLHEVRSRALLLASGGFGKVYKTTSNCFANTGDAQALVLEHGLPLQDPEFVQFHPTGILGLGILISEAARGEGGILRNRDGERFMERYAPTIKDLAPRDIVARSILEEVRAGRGIGGRDYVHLDLTAVGEETIRTKLWEIASFARIYAGVDPVAAPIPVLPTCHYMMGGIPTNSDGCVLRDSQGAVVAGLYAAGECACVSVHGANRLGCNSLLDLVVFGRRAGRAMAEWLGQGGDPGTPDADAGPAQAPLDALRGATGKENHAQLRLQMQEVMMEHCSVFRTEQGLQLARERLAELTERCRHIGLRSDQRHYNTELVEALETRHLLQLARVIVDCALFRRESRGAHYREDYPQRDDDDFLVHTLAFADGGRAACRVETKPVTITRFQPVERTY